MNRAMNIELLTQLLNWPNEYIFGTDLQNIIKGSENRRHSLIKRAVAEGYMLRLKRDLYIISKLNSKAKVNYYQIAQFVYGPSYISFESALSAHGWIPEAVHTISSASIKKSKTFKTPIAVFSYEKIPIGMFLQGVNQVVGDRTSYLLADPWKAVADLIYTRKKNWHNITDLMLDMRIEEDSLFNSNYQLLKELAEHYPHKITQKVLIRIYKSLIEKIGENNVD